MGSAKIVFDEPLGQLPIEERDIIRHVAESQELVLERPVEPLVHGIVLGSLHPGPVVFDAKIMACPVEMLVEFAPVVRLDVLNLPVEQQVQPAEEIAGRC